MSECKVGTHVFVEEICPHCGFTLQDALNQAETRITELEKERDDLRSQVQSLTDCLNGASHAVYTAEMYDALRAENDKLNELMEEK